MGHTRSDSITVFSGCFSTRDRRIKGSRLAWATTGTQEETRSKVNSAKINRCVIRSV